MLKSLDGIFALKVFPIRTQITVSIYFLLHINLVGDLFMLPCVLHVNQINYLTWLINWLIYHNGSIHLYAQLSK